MPHNNIILVIDDESINLQVVIDHLQGVGFDIRVAQSGENGLEQAKHILPDLILLDVQLPGIDGFETCRRLKASRATRAHWSGNPAKPMGDSSWM